MALDEQDKRWIIEQLERFATKEQLGKVETNLLTAFQQWASPMETRMRTHAAPIKAVDAEMEYHDNRIKKLEGRPPAQ